MIKNSVDTVSEYTYLGIKLTSNGKFSDVWGIYKYNKIEFEHWEKTPTEKAHPRFCKTRSYLLNRRASSFASSSEIGRFPLKIAINKQILKYFFRLRDLKENKIVKQAFILSENSGKKGTRVSHSYVDSMQNMYNFNQNILRDRNIQKILQRK